MSGGGDRVRQPARSEEPHRRGERIAAPLRPARRAQHQAAHVVPLATPQSESGAVGVNASRVQRIAAAGVLAVLAMVGAEGCLRGCSSSKPPVHLNPSMFNQPKYKAQAASDFFYDGKTMREPVAGTVARGMLADDPTLVTGMDAGGKPIATSPVTADADLLARGAERYSIYCQPCHDERGEGQGILSQRAKVPTATLLEKRIQDMPDGQIFDTITNGKGLMGSYRYQVPPHDRWAIIAHVRSMEKKNAEQEAAK